MSDVSKICLLPLGMFLLILIDTASGQKDYVEVGGKRFVPVARQRTWHQANQACVLAGMSLAAIESEAEYASLKKYLIEKDLFGKDFWLSGNTLGALDKVEFTWLSNSNTFSYTKWQNGKPDTSIGACIYTDTQFKWVPVACTNTDRKYYICSRPLVPNCGITGRCKRINNFN